MSWFLLALIPPALFGVVNHIDKHLLSRYFRSGGVGALMVFSSIIGAVLLPFIVVFRPEVPGSFDPRCLLISLNGFVYILATLPYFQAIQKEDASLVIALFQLIPLFSGILSYAFLGETLTLSQCGGGILIVSGAVMISIKGSSLQNLTFRRDVFVLMALSSLLYAINFLFFKMFALDSGFWVVSFWEYVGFGIFSVILILCVKGYREEFVLVFRTNRSEVLALNGLNELVNIAAKMVFNAASLLSPITLTWLVNGLQPFFVLLYAVLLAAFFPGINREDFSGGVMPRKILALLVMFVGTFLIQ